MTCVNAEMHEPCDCNPIEVLDSEVIARAVYAQQHLRADKSLKWQAFQPKRGTSDLSIMRTRCMDKNECKAKALEIETNIPVKRYAGFAFLVAAAVRDGGCLVEDSREVYCGHGHVTLPLQAVQPANGEPVDPAITAHQQELGKKLLEMAAYILDPFPETADWPAPVGWYPDGVPAE